MAFLFLDMSPVIQLLSFGMIPNASDLDEVELYFTDDDLWEFYLSDLNVCDREVLEASTLAMLLHLRGEFSCEADWGFRMSSIVWQCAIKNNMRFTKDPSLLDSRITMSLDALIAKAAIGIQLHDEDTLKQCLADGRLDLACEYDTAAGGNLLHLAVQHTNLSAAEALLDAGCDPYQKDWHGCAALHHITSFWNENDSDLLTLFCERGISPLTTDANGRTIWHRWTQSSYKAGFGSLEDVYELDCAATETALLTKDNEGNTPLSLLLRSPSYSSDFYLEQIAKAQVLISLSSKFQGFWEAHPPVLGDAAYFGSREVVQCLLEAGAQTESGEAGTCTPLHALGLGASLDCFELLRSRYPKALEWQFQGQLPIDFYFIRALKYISSVKLDTMDTLIQSTQSWSSIKRSSATIQLLHEAIRNQHVGVVNLLLKYGVDVHQRADGVSSVEVICQPQQVVKLCSTKHGRALLSEILNHTRKEELNEIALAGPGLGLGLLHTLAAPPESHDVCWLIKELVSRGVNLNAQAEGDGDTVLSHHLLQRCSEYAEVLLGLGADPTIVAVSSWGPVQHAVMYDNIGFLKKLMKHVSECGIDMPWTRTFTFFRRPALWLGEKCSFVGSSTIHLASSQGSIKCLNFFLDEHLIPDVNVTSEEGWTSLHLAALGDRSHHLDVIRVLLSKGADVHAKTSDGNTPLHVAARSGSLITTKLLLENGAMETWNAYGKSPRSYASQNGHGSVVQCLEAAQSSVVGQPSALEQDMPFKKRVKFMALAFEDAIVANNIEECKNLLNEGCPIDAKMPKGPYSSPLAAALLLRRTDIARLLLERDASVFDAMCPQCRFRSSIEVAAEDPACNSILSLLLTTYVSQGGDLVRGDDYPFHHATAAGNIKGLVILLRFIGDHTSAIA